MLLKNEKQRYLTLVERVYSYVMIYYWNTRENFTHWKQRKQDISRKSTFSLQKSLCLILCISFTKIQWINLITLYF